MIASEPVLIDCGGERMVGVLHGPTDHAGRGVLVVVGGPQYRVGSHRQFLHLARDLTERGIPVLRFDYRGMGDSDGEQRSFEDIDADIAAAIDELFRRLPALRDVVIWGLCDAASAALMYASRDARVSGLVLLNPWFRSDTTLAKTHLRHYYLARLFDGSFWKRLIAGEVNPLRAAGELVATVGKSIAPAARSASTATAARESEPYTDRMRDGLEVFTGPVLLILSGQDLTAAEFADATAASPRWRELLARPAVTTVRIEEANHTFSRAAWRARVSRQTADWISSW